MLHDREIALGVHRQPVRAAAPPLELDEEADLERPALRIEGHPPDRVRAGHRDVEHRLVAGHDQPVRARDSVDKAFEAPVRGPVPPHPAGGIVQPGEALIGEVKVAVRGEEEVVEALEVREAVPVEEGVDPPAHGVELHDAVHEVRDEDPAVPVDLEPVRLAFVLRDHVPVAGRAHSEDAPVRDIHEPQVSVPIEGRPFEKGADRPAGLSMRPCRGPAGELELLRHPGVRLRLDDGRGGKEHEASSWRGRDEPRSSPFDLPSSNRFNPRVPSRSLP